jgi:hypothetical protein
MVKKKILVFIKFQQDGDIQNISSLYILQMIKYIDTHIEYICCECKENNFSIHI